MRLTCLFQLDESLTFEREFPVSETQVVAVHLRPVNVTHGNATGYSSNLFPGDHGSFKSLIVERAFIIVYGAVSQVLIKFYQRLD